MSSSVRTTRELLDRLRVEDAAPLRAHLESIGVDVPAVRGLPRWNAPGGGVSIPHQRDMTAADRASMDTILTRALTAVAPHPSGPALLAVYLGFECEASWEISYQFALIQETLRALRRLWPLHRDRVPRELDRQAMEAVLRALHLLDLAIGAENEMICGDLAEQGAYARKIVAASELLREHLDATGSDLNGTADHLRAQCALRHRYYSAVEAAAGATVEALSGNGDAIADGIAALLDAEADGDVISPNDRSELRAHRRSLETLARKGTAPWLTVDHGRIVYIYPFGLRGLAAAEAVTRLRENGRDWRLAGIAPTEVRDTLDLDTVWAGSDFLERRFEGAALAFPPVTMTTVDGAGIGELSCELRLSTLGNHYLRLTTEVHETGPHELQFALFRAAPEHGRIDIRVEGSEGTWPWLSSLAVDLVQELARSLARPTEHIAASVRGHRRRRTARAAPEPRQCRGGHRRLRRRSVPGPPGRSRARRRLVDPPVHNGRRGRDHRRMVDAQDVDELRPRQREAMTTPTRFIHLDGDQPLWREAYVHVLAPSFPAAELGDPAALTASIADGRAQATAAVDDDGMPVAIAVGEWSAASRVQLLSYLAVLPASRGLGIGGRLLGHVLEQWRARFAPRLILAEVEHPGSHTASRAHGDPVARLRFYARHGAKALDVPYFQPALRPAAPRAYGMLLLVLHHDPGIDGPAPNTIAAEPVRQFIDEYLDRTEGPLPPSDTAGAALSKALDRAGGIPLLGIDGFERLTTSSVP